MKSEKGQTILVMLLLVAVILTIGLSVVSRSVTDVRISSQTQESARAFWVAQAGLEKAIRTGAGEALTTVGDVKYTVTKSVLGGGLTFDFPDKIEAQQPVNVWLVNHDSNGQILLGERYSDLNLILYWGEPGDISLPDPNLKPAIEATLIYQDDGNKFYSHKYTFDPYSGRGVQTNFSSAEISDNPSSFAYMATISFVGLPSYAEKPYLIILKLLFNTTPKPVRVKGSMNLPNQGNCFTSAAVISSSNVSRSVKECKFWPTAPQIFNYLLYSGTDLVK